GHPSPLPASPSSATKKPEEPFLFVMRSPFFPAFSKDFLGLIFVSLALTRVSLPAVDSYVVSTLAGVPSGHDGHGIEVDFSAPPAVTADANGNIYIADTDHHTIRQV